MRSRAILLAIALPFALACSKAPVDYRKYKSPGDVPRVSVQDAKAEIDAGTAIMVDSRAADAYKFEHIAGAINIPAGSRPDKYADLPQGKKIFIYCSCVNEHTAANLAFQMNQKDIPGTYALIGGNAAWKNAGYPVESTANQ